MMQPKIEVKNITVNYYSFNKGINSLKDFVTGFKFLNPFERKKVLEDVSITVYPGEVFGILGRNGAGKSTLLKSIAGILNPSEGSVVVNGTIAPLLAIGAGMEMELTGIENIRLIGSLLNYSKAEMDAKIEKIIAFSELSLEELQRPVKTFSSGMVSRMSFSLAVADTPDILIIDEVLAVGDRGFRDKCLDRVREIKVAGSTILFVSHNFDEMQKICTRGICIEKGKITAEGDFQKVGEYYKSLFK